MSERESNPGLTAHNRAEGVLMTLSPKPAILGRPAPENVSVCQMGDLEHSARPVAQPSPHRELSQETAIRLVLNRVVSRDYASVKRRLQNYRREQLRLAQLYQIGDLAPEPYGEALHQRIDVVSGACVEESDFAYTSGTVSRSIHSGGDPRISSWPVEVSTWTGPR